MEAPPIPTQARVNRGPLVNPFTQVERFWKLPCHARAQAGVQTRHSAAVTWIPAFRGNDKSLHLDRSEPLE
jgi:hypothetical protein